MELDTFRAWTRPASPYRVMDEACESRIKGTRNLIHYTKGTRNLVAHGMILNHPLQGCYGRRREPLGLQ